MRKILLVLLAAGTFAGCGNKNEAVINGTAPELSDGTTVYLNRSQEKIDSTQITQGKFHFGIKSAYPELLSLSFEGNRQVFPFILEAGTINADFDLLTQAVKFTGTENNELYQEYTRKSQLIAAHMSQVTRAYREEENPVRRDSLMNLFNAIETGELEPHENAFISANRDKIVGALLISRKPANSVEEIDSLLGLLGPNLPANSFVDKMKERRDILESVAIGKPAPDFTMPQRDGTPFTLSTLKGQVVLIDFWAGWCGPCRRENPHVVEVYNKYKDEGFTIVGVSLDRTREEWLQAIEADHLTWTHVSHLKYWDCPTRLAYGVRSIPHTVLVDRNGIIIAKNLRGEALDKGVAQALGM